MDKAKVRGPKNFGAVEKLYFDCVTCTAITVLLNFISKSITQETQHLKLCGKAGLY